MSYVIDVENWTRLEEELAELGMFNSSNEEIRTQAIETANDRVNNEYETFEIISHHFKKDVSYKFCFAVQQNEDEEEGRKLYYHGYFEL